MTVDEQLEVETGDSRNLASPAKVGTELLLARCSLCYDYMHLKCVQTPLWLILSGGFYMKNGYDFERAKKIASQILPLLSGATTLQEAEERRTEIAKMLDEYLQVNSDQASTPFLDIVCDFCYRSRAVDEFIDFYDPETNQTAADLP